MEGVFMTTQEVSVGVDVTIGLRVPWETFYAGSAGLREVVRRAEDSGIDRLTMGDHVSFHDGTGFDGLLQMAALAALTERVEIETAVYLLPLRHPVPVARQVAQVAGLAPGRFVFGIGIGGDDPHEFEVCGVAPRNRGRRTDESLQIVNRLLAGETVDFRGEFFALDAARIQPTPDVPVPVVVGGRGEPAWRRAGRYGNGWLGLFVTPEKFASGCEAVDVAAGEAGRPAEITHRGMHIWCGVDDDPGRLATAMESLYRVPYAKFERYAPAGGPEAIAAFAQRYVDLGARHLNFSPVGASEAAVVECVAEVRRLLLAHNL
jgi:alkanesulfonate monooxygenase SsuD/methylene tetrahydromethanopterin reductase-like flavin-dependent oxidoreductase (luciferase family)